MITLAITHCNRLKYLKALIASLSSFIRDEKPQLILIDNGSVEAGSLEFFKSIEPDWEVVVNDPSHRSWINDEYIAKNEIIRRAKHDIILFLQDDAELVVSAKHLSRLIAAFRVLPHFAMEIEGVRRITVQRRTGSQIHAGPGVCEKVDPHFPTHGLFKTEALRENGEYCQDWPLDRTYWGRSEDEYDKRLKARHPHSLLSCIAKVPCFVSVWNDPRGGYAFIRESKRWGHYRSPKNGSYYIPLNDHQISFLEENPRPSTFLDLAQPNGWRLALDQSGEIYKYPQSSILIEGPAAALESSDDV